MSSTWLVLHIFHGVKGVPKLVCLKIDKFITVSRKEKLSVKTLLLTLTKRNWPSAVKTITPLRPFVKAPPKNSKTENTEICTCLFFFYIIFIIHACKYLFQYYICYKTLFFSVEIYLTDIWPRFLPPFSVFVKNPYGYIWISLIYMSGLVVSKSYNNRHMRISKTDSGESSKCIVLMVLQKKIEKSFF